MVEANGSIKLLLAGESRTKHSIDQWGFSSYSVGEYGEGHGPLKLALESEGVEFHYLPNHLAIEEFPWTLEALQEFDVIILSDISADTLVLHPDAFVHNKRTPNRLSLICDYVAAGGGFMMIGGYMSFSGIGGKANYHFSPVADVLPVRMYGFDDRVETPEGIAPDVVVPQHPVLTGIDGNWPHFLGYNKLILGDSGEVLLRFGGDPLLAVRTVGEGRTAAFASDCVGHWGSREFLDWDHYGRFWGQVVKWLSNAE